MLPDDGGTVDGPANNEDVASRERPYDITSVARLDHFSDSIPSPVWTNIQDQMVD